MDGDRVDRLVVAGGDGETTVKATDTDSVRVTATKYAVGQTDLSDVEITRTVRNGRLRVGASLNTGFTLGVAGGGLERLDVAVPRDVAVERVGTDDGSARVRGVAGDPVVAVDDGELQASELDGTVEVSGDDGTVRLGAVGGVTGQIDDGRLRMNAPATLGDVSADDGELRLAADALDGTPVIEVDDGSVDLALASSLDATVEIRVDDGSVAADALSDVTVEGDRTRGTIGDGSGQLRIRADDGSVRVRSLDG